MTAARVDPEWITFGDVGRFRAARQRQLLGRGTFKKVSEIELEGATGGKFAHAEYRPHERWLESEYNGRVRFCREVRAMRDLSDANVMPVLAADLSGEHPWFVMPLADENFEGMAQSVRSRSEAADALRQMVDGVAAMHAKGYIHRDLKTNNIFRVDGRWVIGDLGLLRDIGRVSDTYGDLTLLGSHRAPEVRMSMREATKASDVFSIGWIVRNTVPMVERMVTGRSQSFGAMKSAPLLHAVVNRCLQEEEEDRYPSAIELRPDLFSALEEWAGAASRT